MRGLTALETDLQLFMRALSSTTVVPSKRAVSLYDQTVTASRRRPAVTPRSLLQVACAGIGIFSRHCRQDKQTEAKATGNFLCCPGFLWDDHGNCWARIIWIRVSWWVVDVYLQYCLKDFW